MSACSLFAAAPALAAPGGLGDSFFWSSRNDGFLGHTNTEGDGATINSANFDGPTGVAVDLRGGRIFYGVTQSNSVEVANLDGSQAQRVLSDQFLDNPEGIAIDPEQDALYASDYQGRIVKSRMDGSRASLFTGPAQGSSTVAIAIDTEGQRLFWTGYTAIYSKALDGSGPVERFSTGTVPIQTITGLAVAGDKLYWSDTTRHTVAEANLDGSGAPSVLPSTGTDLTDTHGLSVDTDAGRLYAGNGTGSSLNYVNLDGSGGGQLASQPVGSTSPSYPVLVQRPQSTSAPRVAVSAADGVLRCSRGEWAPDDLGAFRYRTPAGFAYQWQRDGEDVPGATGEDLTPSGPGSYRCLVTAENPVGSTTRASANYLIAAPASAPQGVPTPSAPVRPRDITPPFVTDFAVIPVRFGVLPRGSRSAARRVHFTVSEPATVVLTVQQRRRGAWRTIRRIARRVTAGSHTMRFSGRIRPRDKGRALRPGSYRMRFRAGDHAGNTSPVSVRSFRVMP